jgi:YbbR domain-containing protein
MDITSVDVSVTGPRSVTGDLTADDIIVYPSITGIDGPGSYTFVLTSDKTSNISNFTINSYSKDNVTVRFDRLISKEFPVEVDISSVVVDSNYMAERPTTNPSTVTITGPEYKINSISRVVAATVTTETLSQTAVLPSKVSLYDENGGLIDDKLLSMNVAEVDITIPITKEVILPVKVEYVNVPAGFDTGILHQ